MPLPDGTVIQTEHGEWTSHGSLWHTADGRLHVNEKGVCPYVRERVYSLNEFDSDEIVEITLDDALAVVELIESIEAREQL